MLDAAVGKLRLQREARRMTAAEELKFAESRACASRFFLAVGRAARERWRDEWTCAPRAGSRRIPEEGGT